MHCSYARAYTMASLSVVGFWREHVGAQWLSEADGEELNLLTL